MGDPQPYEDSDKPKSDAPRPVIERVDWLVGPEDGLSEAIQRALPAAEPPPGAPRLTRPEAPDAGRSHARPLAPLALPGRASLPPSVPSAASPAMPSWDPGHSSVPKLRRSQVPGEQRPMPPLSEPTRDFPMDDAEERARASAQQQEVQAREAAIAARPHEVVAPREFDIPSLPLPWWSQVPQLLRFDRRVQLVLLTMALVLAVIALRPRPEKTISVGHLKEHAERYADTQVRVGGRVGEVFAVGGSWAYTLVQGRDTIVVFSRTRRPKPREKIIVVGTLSNGYLDGQSRAAIFEATR